MLSKISEELERENYLVLSLMQASIGLISPNLRLLSLVTRGKDATLLFIFEKDLPENAEDVEDIGGDYCAFTFNNIDSEYDVEVKVIGDRDFTVEDIVGRCVYARKW